MTVSVLNANLNGSAMLANANVTASVEMLTAQDAEYALSMSTGNRTIRKARVAKMLADAKAGRYILTHQGIAFCCDGTFIDGHHRMTMLKQHGGPLPFLVVRGLSLDAKLYVDQNAPRSPADSIKMAGHGDYSNRFIAMVRMFACVPAVPSPGRFNTRDILDLISEYEEAFIFADRCFSSSDIGISRGIRALLARAYYTCDNDRLREFANVLKTGMVVSAGSDSAAVTLRNYLLRNTKQHGETIESEKYKKAQSCLWAFVRGESMLKAVGTEKDLFPMPDVCSE